MTPYFPGDAQSPEEARAAAFTNVFFYSGWSQHLPPAAATVLTPFATSEAPLARDDLEGFLRFADTGWDSPAWEPLKDWTDEELRDLDAQFEGTAFATSADRPQTAADVMAQEAAQRAEHVAELDAYSLALGVRPVRTLGDLLEFMVAADVVRKIEAPEGDQYQLNANAPLPEEVLPVSEEKRRQEGMIRWRELHYPTSQDIIRLFDPDAGTRPDRKRTSLQRLAREIGVDVESARQGLLVLLEEGDFTATRDPETALEHQVFEIVVDWERFANTRFGLRADRRDQTDNTAGRE